MKITKKIIAGAVMAFAAAGLTFAFDADEFKNNFEKKEAALTGGLNDFSKELGIAVPQAAVQQNVYSDAFIGKVFPAVPPHFAAGINAGFTHINTTGIKKAAEALEISGMKENYYFPVLNADIRVGGVFLPFDVGISFMKLNVPELSFLGSNLDVDFFTFAIDGRYAVLEDGLITPCISIGAGYSMNSGTFAASNKAAEAGVDYDVHTFYLQTQISKSINIPVVKIGFTPFVGVRAVVSSYDNDWSWKIKDSAAVTAITAAGVKASDAGTSSSKGFDFSAMQPQIYGGCSFNFMLVQLTACACADLRNLSSDSLWSGVLSLRFKM